MKNIIISFIVGVIVGAIGMWFLKKCDTVPIKIPVDIEVPIPIEDSIFDPIINPKPIKETPKSFKPKPINKDLKKDLDSSKTIIDSLAIYKKFAIKRTYKDSLVDDIQTINYNIEATGTVDKIQIGYKTKPRTINYKDTLKIDIPSTTKFFVGGSIFIPKNNNISLDIPNNIYLKPSIKPGLLMINKKDTKAYNIEIDPINKTGELGLYFRF